MTTKIWQLERIASQVFQDRGRLMAFLCKNPSWNTIYESICNFESLVKSQDRDALDAIVDDAIVLQLFQEVDCNFYISMDIANEELTVRAYRKEATDQQIGAVDALLLVGGEGLEEVFEKGGKSIRYPTSR